MFYKMTGPYSSKVNVMKDKKRLKYFSIKKAKKRHNN